jgi:FemAB-related protein (PEP-CTERM system-associated)
MTTAARALSPAEKKQLLKDPIDWVRQHRVRVGKRALSEILAQRQSLLDSSQGVTLESRELSKAIGTAKKTGVSPDTLLAQKRLVSAQEKKAKGELKALEARLFELLTPSGVAADILPNTGSQLEQPIDISAVEIVKLQAKTEQAWDDLVEQHPSGSVYHLSGMRSVIEQSFGHETDYLTACEGQKVVGVLPLVRLTSRLFGDFMVSQPYFNYGGVLALNDAVADLLLSAAEQLARHRGCSHIEYRDCALVQGLPVRTDKVAMWLGLPDSEQQLWQQIGTKVRAQIKRGARFGLEAESGGIELLDDFYRVFAENMRDLGTPVYDKDFFRNLLESMVGDRRLVIVRHQGKPVSAAFLLGYKLRMEVPWASTLRSANCYDANMFLYWELLRQACNSRYRIFDFGRSTQDAPTYRFKKQWGAQPKQLYWHYWLRDGGEPPKINPDNPKYRLLISAWKRLPVWLTQLLGPRIVKYLP